MVIMKKIIVIISLVLVYCLIITYAEAAAGIPISINVSRIFEIVPKATFEPAPICDGLINDRIGEIGYFYPCEIKIKIDDSSLESCFVNIISRNSETKEEIPVESHEFKNNSLKKQENFFVYEYKQSIFLDEKGRYQTEFSLECCYRNICSGDVFYKNLEIVSASEYERLAILQKQSKDEKEYNDKLLNSSEEYNDKFFIISVIALIVAIMATFINWKASSRSADKICKRIKKAVNKICENIMR